MRNPTKGVLALFLASMIYGLYGVYARFIGKGFGVFAQNWIRNLFVAVCLLVLFLLFKLKFKPLRREDFKWILAWVLSGSTPMLFIFVSFNNLPLGTVYFLSFATMIIGGYLAGSLLYQERFNTINIITIFLAFIGLFLVYSFNIPSGKFIYALFALLAGFLTGLWNTLSRKFSHHYLELQLVFIDAIFTCLVSFLGWLFVKDAIPAVTISGSWLWMVIYTISQIITVILIIIGFKNLEAQVGSIIMPVEVIFANFFGFLIFGEILPPAALLGGLMIVVAAIIPSLNLLLQRRIKKD